MPYSPCTVTFLCHLRSKITFKIYLYFMKLFTPYMNFENVQRIVERIFFFQKTLLNGTLEIQVSKLCAHNFSS